MRTSNECEAKASEMDAFAEACNTAAGTESFQRMALSWRCLARQAAWQDGMPHLMGPRAV
jgi:hypothetical protein